MLELIRRYNRALAKTERMSARELERYQELLLVRLIRHAHSQLPFYRERLGVLFTANEEVDLSHWKEIPILRRDEGIERGREMRVSRLSADYGAIGEGRTSGSTGVPLEMASNELVFIAAKGLFKRMMGGAGLYKSTVR